MNEKFEELIESFLNTRIGISNHFLSENLALRLKTNLKNLNNDDKLKKAGIGNLPINDILQDRRGDKIYWIDCKTKNEAECVFLTQIEEFILYLNDTCYAGINACEFHYALYESGKSYKRHIDQFQNNSDRKFSMIHYLNEDWLKEDGGELSIYQEDMVIKIQPSIRKAVFFSSDSCMHEVCESSRPRMSISGWLKSC